MEKISGDIRKQRIMKEIKMMKDHPPPNISCYPKDDLTEFEACILGNVNTPFENGIFRLKIEISKSYPFEPPKILFLTRIYHPNIDISGRICLDILEAKGWKPSLNICTTLMSVQLLMNYPNIEDPLVVEIAEEYCHNKELYLQKAKECTMKYARINSPLKVGIYDFLISINCFIWKRKGN